VDLLHDEVQGVREAAAHGLLKLAALARPGSLGSLPCGGAAAAGNAQPVRAALGPYQAPTSVGSPAGAAAGAASAGALPPANSLRTGTAAAAAPAAAADANAPVCGSGTEAAGAPLLVVLLDREQMLSFMSGLSDPSDMVGELRRPAACGARGSPADPKEMQSRPKRPAPHLAWPQPAAPCIVCLQPDRVLDD